VRSSATISCLLAAAALWLPPALAGTFTISPLRVDLSREAPTAALTVRNEESAPVVVQAEAMLWSQAGGTDVLELTRDVLVSPAVFTLPPNGSQLVRVALRRAADARTELDYRLLLQEVPQKASADFTGLQVALRLSLPVFVAAVAPAEPRLEWTAERAPDGRLVVRAANAGTAHARVLSFTLTPEGSTGQPLRQSVATYVLPGHFRTWTLDDKNNDRDDNAAGGGRYRLQGHTDRGEVVAELPVVR
jgi:fimbrial chaperone protein